MKEVNKRCLQLLFQRLLFDVMVLIVIKIQVQKEITVLSHTYCGSSVRDHILGLSFVASSAWPKPSPTYI